MASHYQGYLQEVTKGNHLLGWAWNPKKPDEVLQISVLVDGVERAVIAADMPRKDLKSAGVKGDHGYRLDLGQWLSDGRAHRVETRYLHNNAPLGRSPLTILPPSTPAPTKPKPDLAVILGMHRSGTSLGTRILSSHGLSIGDNLIAGQTDNPDGFFENAAIVACQQKMETALSREHYSPQGTHPFPEDWLLHPEVCKQKEQLKQIITEELAANTAPLWAFKDPRSLRFLPLWQQIFQELDLQPAYILCLRDPHAVIQSLWRRNAHPHSQIELLWLIHFLEGLEQLDIRDTHIIHYENWFTSPTKQFRAAIKALGLELPPGKVLKTILHKIISKRKNHFQLNKRDRALHPHTQALYHMLSTPLETAEDDLKLRLLLAEIRRNIGLFQPWQISDTPS